MRLSRRRPPGRLLSRLARAAFVAAAAPAVVRAALRVSRELARSEVRELPGRLRRVEPFALAALARPAWLDGTTARLLPLLPPRGVGRCLKRSLILLDLWSRCGLEPRLHVGVRRPGRSGPPSEPGQGATGDATAGQMGGERRDDPLEAHAWVTVGDPRLDRRTGPDGWEELWSG
ncbi:MAG TPA: hypothetical protein VHQ65_17370 [Thermoanaerobaculia bacterium]|nr:hypothetical protein [Thermoanaerobaculia bacterium]